MTQAQAQALSQAMVGTEADQVPAQNKLKINCARSSSENGNGNKRVEHAT